MDKGEKAKKKKKTRSVQTNSVIRTFKVLKILKEETDEENPLTQNEILYKLKGYGMVGRFLASFYYIKRDKI